MSGFALNRATIFTIVSLIVIGSFVVLEWALNEWIRNVNHITSTILNIALALCLGLSIRAIHSRVDHVVDRLLFRKRHEDESALRRFAHEAAYISNMNVLLERTIDVVQERAQAAHARIVLTGDSEVDPDDEALVAMRTWH